MSDAHLRELERRFRASGALADEVRWLTERLRVGELTGARVEQAARLGNVGACRVLGLEPGSALDPTAGRQGAGRGVGAVRTVVRSSLDEAPLLAWAADCLDRARGVAPTPGIFELALASSRRAAAGQPPSPGERADARRALDAQPADRRWLTPWTHGCKAALSLLDAQEAVSVRRARLALLEASKQARDMILTAASPDVCAALESAEASWQAARLAEQLLERPSPLVSLDQGSLQRRFTELLSWSPAADARLRTHLMALRCLIAAPASIDWPRLWNTLEGISRGDRRPLRSVPRSGRGWWQLPVGRAHVLLWADSDGLELVHVGPATYAGVVRRRHAGGCALSPVNDFRSRVAIPCDFPALAGAHRDLDEQACTVAEIRGYVEHLRHVLERWPALSEAGRDAIVASPIAERAGSAGRPAGAPGGG